MIKARRASFSLESERILVSTESLDFCRIWKDWESLWSFTDSEELSAPDSIVPYVEGLAASTVAIKLAGIGTSSMERKRMAANSRTIGLYPGWPAKAAENDLLTFNPL